MPRILGQRILQLEQVDDNLISSNKTLSNDTYIDRSFVSHLSDQIKERQCDSYYSFDSRDHDICTAQTEAMTSVQQDVTRNNGLLASSFSSSITSCSSFSLEYSLSQQREESFYVGAPLHAHLHSMEETCPINTLCPPSTFHGSPPHSLSPSTFHQIRLTEIRKLIHSKPNKTQIIISDNEDKDVDGGQIFTEESRRVAQHNDNKPSLLSCIFDTPPEETWGYFVDVDDDDVAL